MCKNLRFLCIRQFNFVWNTPRPSPTAEKALKIIAALPGVETLYAPSPVSGVRRVYLRRIDAHLYYTFDDARVIVRALWGARRERGPQL